VIPLKYDHPSIVTFMSTMLSAHDLFVRVRLLDLDHNYLEDLSPPFVDGQVSFDTSESITRALDLTLFDPLKAIHLDPDSPSPTGIFLTNMISITYVVRTPGRASVWEIPVFTGPIDDVDRDGLYLNIKCLGKESLSLANLYHGKHYKKTQAKTDVIVNILRTLCGETKFAIPTLNVKMANDLSLSRENIPWLAAKKLAASMGQQLFYDGRGVARMRRVPASVSFTYRDVNLTTVPRVSYDLSTTINAVDVVGGKPKKAKNRVKYQAIAPRSHVLSPQNLGRGTPRIPRYLWVEIKDDNITSQAEAIDVGSRQLAQGLLAGVEVAFDGIPNPLAEELDIGRLASEQASTNFHHTKWTLPLVAGTDAAYGYLKRVPARGRTVKRGGKKK
jgi:hypothetical protein